MKLRLSACIALAVILYVLAGSAALCQDEWTMFRQNDERTGWNEDPAALGPYRPQPIWVFPVAEDPMPAVDNDYPGPTGRDEPNFTSSGDWTSTPLQAEAPFGWDYLMAATDGTGAKWARWSFAFGGLKSKTDSAEFFIYVWFPSQGEESPLPHTWDAHYTVRLNDMVLGQYTLDQTYGGGWVNLGYRSFPVHSADVLSVELTNKTEDRDEQGNLIRSMVIADAVMIEQNAGMVLSSPAVCRNSPVVVSCVTELVSFLGLWEEGLRSLGVIYGIGSEVDSGISDFADDRGLMKWRYPPVDRNWIQGGISSSPTIVGSSVPGGEFAVVPACDGQVYAVDAVTGEPIWQGPGYIKDNPTSWVDETEPWVMASHAGYQGSDTTRYYHAKAIKVGSDTETPSTATWTLNISPPVDRSYAIYAWIPPSTSTERYISDARYTVQIGDGDSARKTEVRIDQASGGMWALLWSPFDWYAFRIKAPSTTVHVTLTNETAATDYVTGDPPANAYVAADAIKIVPAGLWAFDFSSPIVQTETVTDSSGFSYDRTCVYVGGVPGWIYKLAVGDNEPIWTYPKLDEQPIGAVYASPALSGSTLYVGSSDGHVYALDKSTGALKWVWPLIPTEQTEIVYTLGQVSSTTAVEERDGSKYVYVGVGGWGSGGFGFNTEGRVLCLADRDTWAELIWWYPGSAGDSKGAFLYSSPLLMKRPTDTTTSLFIGSTDGYLYGVDTVGDPMARITTDRLSRVDLGNSIYSSAAGTIAQDYRRRGSPNPSQAVPLAFLGTGGGRIYGVDLETGLRDWWWDLMGGIISSPAICNDRIYVGDWFGFTWAFSTRDLGGTAGGEAWNPELGAGPPTAGSDDTTGQGREAKPEVDVFTRQQYDDLIAKMRTSAQDTLPIVLADTDLHKLARDYGNRDAAKPFIHEWGEDICIIVWNVLDPNEKGSDPTKWLHPGEAGFIGKLGIGPDGGHKVDVTFRTTEPGKASDSNDTHNIANDSGYYILNEIDPDDQKNKVVFYAKYLYVLDGSTSSRPQTPGSNITVSAREVPPRPDTSSAEQIYVLTDQSLPNRIENAQPFTINNPLGLFYPGTTPPTTVGVAGSPPNVTTGRDRILFPDVAINGNVTVPQVWSGYTAHNSTSERKPTLICDRSLLGGVGRRITRFRIERNDLKWTGQNPIPSFISAWELAPQDARLNRPNLSRDYPDISLRQLSCLMAAGQDPAQQPAALMPTHDPAARGLTPPDTWSVGVDGANLAVAVPRFQPPNMPASEADLQTSGYTGHVFVYVDSNNNGVFDKPAALGISAAQRRAMSGVRAEAYRVLRMQLHVPVDRRVQIVEQRINVGLVPHGFGFTEGADDVPALFSNTLAYDSYVDQYGLPHSSLSPPYFGEWFKPFTAKNIGNVNLLNVQLARSNLMSDTVQRPFFGVGGSLLPGSGYFVPSSRVVSALDPAFLASVPPVVPTNARTFHKARVGEAPTTLMIPDFPPRLAPQYSGSVNIPGSPGTPQPPTFSVAVPLGLPVGTYYGRIQLAEVVDSNTVVPISNPAEVVISATEARLTDGYWLGAPPHLPHLDTGLAGGSPVPATGDATPAAYRDRLTGNIHLFWASSRYGEQTRGGGGANPTAADPWYLYMTTLKTQSETGTPGNWLLSGATPAQWWAPTSPSEVFPPLSSVNDLFPEPTSNDPRGGAPGVLIPGSAKFSSPSVAVDEVDGKAWLLFSGQAYKDAGTGLPGTQSKALESRVYYTNISGGKLVPEDIFPVARDWTMPKFGIRGAALRRDFGGSAELWSFWYGGSSNRWRIYYSANPAPDNPANGWTNEAQLPVPDGLNSAAEPSPVVRYWGGRTGDTFDIVYSGYSTFHKNSDVYLSRYKPAVTGPAPANKGGHWPVELQNLPPRAAWIQLGARALMGEKLERDPSKAVWCARDIDWDAKVVSLKDGRNPSFRVFVCPDPTSSDPVYNTVYQVNDGSYTRDSTTGAIAFSYEDDAPAIALLRQLFRAVVINPVEGTVKFLKAPGSKAVVVAQYKPRAYRLTTDAVADASPFALLDDDPNPRYIPGNPPGSPFFFPSGAWDPDVAPPTDRLWLFWQRPGLDKPAGVYYKSYRYMIQLNAQIALIALSPDTRAPALEGVIGAVEPVEIDWVKNRLYFTKTDAINASNPVAPTPRQVLVSYTDVNGTPHADEPYYVEFTEEEMGRTGKTFGNLTSLTVNEGQVGAFKDPWDNKVWAFWSSTRSGNSDLYYEAISPLFYGLEFK